MEPKSTIGYKKLVELFTKSVKEERKATLLVLELVAEMYGKYTLNSDTTAYLFI
ncbi:MAG: hypothetical protein R3A13_02745 [Bdellovibrionota bacterium]